MTLKHLFKASAVAVALVLAGCGGDINISEGDVDNSTTTNNNGGTDNPDTGTGTPDDPATATLPGVFDAALTQAVTNALGRNVTVQRLSGTITEDTTLSSDAFYALDGTVFVGGDNESSAVLTVEPGTVIFGRDGGDALVISRGSRIEADATAAEPVILTSLQDVVGEPTGPGQWGGMVLLGNADNNQCPTDGTPCAREVEGVPNAFFGGTDDEDNSGTLRYVVLKNSGFEVTPGNELNGITFAGVGSGTTVEFVQVDSSSDDGVEFFGGTVDVKYLILTNNQDDSIDWDQGYRGRMQHIFVRHNPNSTDANRIIEADNDGSTPDNTPASRPTIANMTAIGNNFDGDDDSEGVYLREGTGALMYNVFVTGPEEMGECFEVESVPVSQANLSNGNIIMENSVFSCTNGETFRFGADDVDLEDWFLNVQQNNFLSDAPMVMSDGNPLAGSPLLGAGQDVANTVDNFFDSVDYIGAFSADEDWRDGWAFGFGGGTVTAPVVTVGCPTGTTSVSPADGSTTTCLLPSSINSDITLTAGNLYAIDGITFVGGDNQDSAVLTIEAGVTVFGRSAGDALVVSRGSQIMAEGSANSPIRFTSEQDVVGEATGPGQWGGIVLLGNAVNNRCPTDGTPCAREVEGVPDAFFGGTDDADNSGVLRYVVVSYGGFEVTPGNELNGITFAGVGSNTTVEYIQVHQNSDDGIEFFGGTVDAKYVVLTDNQDDSVDWDQGYRGRMQFVLARQAADDSDANRLIEADNEGSTPDLAPRSFPTIANFTGIGNNFDADDDSEGPYLREGTAALLYNFVVTGPEGMGECLEVEGIPESQALLTAEAPAERIEITNSVWACENGENFSFEDDEVDLEAFFLSLPDNAIAAGRADVLDGIFTITTNPARDFTGDTFFDNVDFIGAVSESDNWTAGWTIGLE